MEEKNERYLGIAFGSGLILGGAIGLTSIFLYKKNQALTSKEVLRRVQRQFKREGIVLTSWIHDTKESHHQFAIHTKIYKGGIICREDDLVVTYEFSADAKTGTVLSVERFEEEEV